MDRELSRRNPVLFEEILKDPEASTWESTVHEPYTLHEVPTDSAEYAAVRNKFSATARGMTIRRIQRVENPYLLGHYLLKREKMKRKYSTVRELSLFHGTRKMFLDGICKYNFDWRKRGSSRGHKFGQGVSFAPEVSYARHYTPFGDNVLILAKVLVGQAVVGTTSTVVPKEPSDTTRNPQGSVLVKYEDDDFYPEYIIHFSRCPSSPAFPDFSDFLDIPDIPDFTDFLDVPDIPDYTDFLDIPDIPDFSDFLDIPDFTDFLDVPDIPDYTDFLDIPDIPDFSDFLDIPDIPDYTDLFF